YQARQEQPSEDHVPHAAARGSRRFALHRAVVVPEYVDLLATPAALVSRLEGRSRIVVSAPGAPVYPLVLERRSLVPRMRRGCVRGVLVPRARVSPGPVVVFAAGGGMGGESRGGWGGCHPLAAL